LLYLILNLIKVIINVSLNSNNVKGVNIKGINIKEANIISANIANKSSLNNWFKDFFFLIKKLIHLYSF
jgi:uncharacterized protein YjbI with pentapeptide repeats